MGSFEFKVLHMGVRFDDLKVHQARDLFGRVLCHEIDQVDDGSLSDDSALLFNWQESNYKI